MKVDCFRFFQFCENFFHYQSMEIFLVEFPSRGKIPLLEALGLIRLLGWRPISICFKNFRCQAANGDFLESATDCEDQDHYCEENFLILTSRNSSTASPSHNKRPGLCENPGIVTLASDKNYLIIHYLYKCMVKVPAILLSLCMGSKGIQYVCVMCIHCVYVCACVCSCGCVCVR